MLIFCINEDWSMISPSAQCDRLYVIPNLHVLLFNNRSQIYNIIMKDNYFKRCYVIAATAVYDNKIENLCNNGNMFRQPLIVYHQVYII